MSWFSDIGDFIGDIDLGGAKDLLEFGGGALALGSGIDGLFDDSAEDASAAQRRSLAFQRMLAERTAAIGDEAGGDLAEGFKSYLESIGQLGLYSPEQISGIADRIADDRYSERDQEAAAVQDIMGQLRGTADELSQGTDYSQFTDIPLGDYRQYADVGAGDYGQFANVGAGNYHDFAQVSPANYHEYSNTPVGNYHQFAGVNPGNYHQFADVAPGEYMGHTQGLQPGGYYDEMGRIQADVGASEGNYDGLVNQMARGYLDRFSDNTDRAVDRIYANQEVDAIRKGMDRSTYDIMGKRAASAEAKKLYDKDVTRAIDEALQYVSGRQGLDQGNQGMRMRQLEGEQSVAGLGMNARGRNTSDAINIANMRIGAEQQNTADRFNAAQMGMTAEQQNTADRFNAAQMGMTAEQRYIADMINRAQFGMTAEDKMMRDRFSQAELGMTAEGQRMSDLFNDAKLGMSAEQQRYADLFNNAQLGMDAEARSESGRFKRAGIQMDAARQGYMDKIGALDAARNLRGGAQSIRNNQWNTPNVGFDSMGKAFNVFGKYQQGRQGGLNELMTTIGKPYEFQSTGVSNAGNVNSPSITGWGNNFQTSSGRQISNNKTLGYGFSKTIDSWDNIFGDDD